MSKQYKIAAFMLCVAFVIMFSFARIETEAFAEEDLSSQTESSVQKSVPGDDVSESSMCSVIVVVGFSAVGVISALAVTYYRKKQKEG